MNPFFRAPRKTPIYPSLLVRKTPDSFGEKGRDEAKKRTVFRDALNRISIKKPPDKFQAAFLYNEYFIDFSPRYSGNWLGYHDLVI